MYGRSTKPKLGIHIILIQDTALIKEWKKFSQKQVKKT